MSRISKWITDNPIGTVAVILVIDAAFMALLLWLTGCAPASRYSNGDRTVMSPPTYQEVTEPDMVKPEPEPN